VAGWASRQRSELAIGALCFDWVAAQGLGERVGNLTVAVAQQEAVELHRVHC
jgi:hypothetical protein